MVPSVETESNSFGSETPRRTHRPLLLTVHLALIVLLGGVGLLNWRYARGSLWNPGTGLALCLILSLILRSGWIAPCMVFGTILLGFAMSLPGMDDRETATSKLVVGVFGGAFFGFLVGYGIDHPAFETPESPKEEP